VRYQDLAVKPKVTVEAIYNRIGFPMTDEYQGILEIGTKKAQKFTSHHIYSLEEMGLDDQRIHQEFDEVIEKII